MTLSIKSKLFGGFAIILLLLMGMAVFMLNQFSASNDRLAEIVNFSTQKVNVSNEITYYAQDIARLEKNLLLEEDPVQQGVYRDQLLSLLENVNQKTSELYDLADDSGKSILDQFRASWDIYRSRLEQIVDLQLQGSDQQAFQVSKEAGGVRNAAIDQLHLLIEKNEADIRADKSASDQSFSTSFNLIVSFVTAGILIALIIAYLIIQGIGRRIASIAQKAEKIASREYTMEDLEDPVGDELKPLIHSLGSINESFREVTENANRVASGKYDIDLQPRSARDMLGHALQKMTFSLQESTRSNELHSWMTTGQNQLNTRLMGNQGIGELADHVISFLVEYLKADIGAVYLLDEKTRHLELKGRYGLTSVGSDLERFSVDQGLVGQAAREKRPLSLTEVSADHLRISSAGMDASPGHVLITPFLFEERVLGVLEIGKRSSFTEEEQEFLETSIESIALSVHSAIARQRVQELLSETQVQSEELQTQQEELKQMNEELEEQTQNLKQQQEELQMTNEELEEQTQSLETKNREIEAAKFDVEQKTKQLEISSKYKSEFLANMSHELRTPLNSLLILSKDLFDNKSENLTEDQVESAEIIYKSGHDLLILINEVLDLSRVEAGKMDVHLEDVKLRQFIEKLLRDFKHQASQKGLELGAEFKGELPEFIHTDPQRLNQILKNLLSNAVKFTEEGSVTLAVSQKSWNSLEISVKDTGIGIKEDKQMAIFEAFQQADGGTARKYGGTGLGLSISRELAKLLSAEITLESTPNAGSVFSVTLPVKQQASNGIQISPILPEPVKTRVSMSPEKFLDYPSILDDREEIKPDDKMVLIVEDDLKFAGILKKQANEKGFKCLAAATGEDGLQLAMKYKPHAIILDIDLPGMSGEQVLSQIKANPEIRHIPVHIASVNERSLRPIREGAVEYLMKPVAKKELDEAFNRIEQFVSRKMKNLLLIEDDANSRTAIRKLIGNGDVHSIEAGSGKEALEMYQENHIDCIVLDIGLPDMTGFELIYQLEKLNDRIPPIIIYTGKELSKEENEELEKYAESIIIKGVKSEERLLDETALFLHRTIRNLPESKQKIITGLYDKEAIFQGRNILVVDDDMRNVFALSKVLKERGMRVLKAEHGKNALDMLDKHPEVDLVLMDIMMPEMDGYEAMRKIREQPRFKDLPVIALTAKAMKDDKQKCINAGANDYITKPVDVPRLLSLMQVWLSK